jgi:hypothetical protein
MLDKLAHNYKGTLEETTLCAPATQIVQATLTRLGALRVHSILANWNLGY